jgi:hypothetical protein
VPGRAGRLRASINRWATQDHEEARELQRTAARSGCRAIVEVRDRDRCELEGVLKTVTLRPRGGVPALEAELFDGTGSVTLIWLGRRRIAGIEPGRAVRVEGRVGCQEDTRTMFNPSYDLRPS